MADAKRDANRVPTLIGVSNADTTTPILVAVDPATNRLLTNSISTLSTLEYTEGDTDTTITGIATMWEDTSDTLRVVSAAKPLPISDAGGSTIVQETLDHGSNLDVDTSAEVLTATNFVTKRGVLVKADLANSGVVYIGNSDVTAGTTDATDGMALSAGESIEVEINNPNKLYVIGSANNQKVYWISI